MYKEILYNSTALPLHHLSSTLSSIISFIVFHSPSLVALNHQQNTATTKTAAPIALKFVSGDAFVAVSRDGGCPKTDALEENGLWIKTIKRYTLVVG